MGLDKIIQKNKKGQEEIVGFVTIVLLVAVIVVIILGLMLRNDDVQVRESKDVRRLLDSMMQYTSDCALSYVPNYASLADLIQKCYDESGTECKSGEKICSALNRTLIDILETSIKTGAENANRGYQFKTVFSVNISSNEGVEIIKVLKGNCSTTKFAEGYGTFQGREGIFINTLRICS